MQTTTTLRQDGTWEGTSKYTTVNSSVSCRQPLMLESGPWIQTTQARIPSGSSLTTRQPSADALPPVQQQCNTSPLRSSATSTTSSGIGTTSRSTLGGYQDTQRLWETRLPTSVQRAQQSSLTAAATPSHPSHTSSDRSNRRALRSCSTCGRLQAEARSTAASPEGSYYGGPPGSQLSSRTQTRQPHRQSTNYGWDTDTSEHS